MGILRGKLEDYSSPLVGVPARLYTGYFFLAYGVQSVSGGFGGEALRQALTEWAAKSPYDFYLPFMEAVLLPHPAVFAYFVMFAGIAVGVSLLLGCATRLAAAAGMFLSLNLLFASGAPLLSTEEPVLFTLLLMVVYATAAGRSLGLDWVLKNFLPRWAA